MSVALNKFTDKKLYGKYKYSEIYNIFFSKLLLDILKNELCINIWKYISNIKAGRSISDTHVNSYISNVSNIYYNIIPSKNAYTRTYASPDMFQLRIYWNAESYTLASSRRNSKCSIYTGIEKWVKGIWSNGLWSSFLWRVLKLQVMQWSYTNGSVELVTKNCSEKEKKSSLKIEFSNRAMLLCYELTF